MAKPEMIHFNTRKENFNMTKAIRISVLATLLAALSITGCGDDTLVPGIFVGTSSPTFSGMSLADAAKSTCGSGCDGQLDDYGLPAFVGNADADALRTLVLLRGVMWLGDGNIASTDIYMDTIADLDEPTELTFRTSRTTNCNSVGTGESDLGDASDGVIVETYTVRRSYDSEGTVAEADRDYWRTFTFTNCTISGDLLDEVASESLKGADNGSAVRLNGFFATHWHEPETPSGEDLMFNEYLGTVSLSTDRDADGTFGNEFWTHIVNIDAIWNYDGSESTYNGGVCAGEAIDFGEDDTTDEDDNCTVPGTDMTEDAWWDAGYIAGP